MDLAGNADQLEKQFRAAAAGGAQIAVAPEASLDGLTALEIQCGLLPPASIYQTALTLQSPTIRRFQSLARELQMCLVFGFDERIGSDVYNSAVFIDNQGKICGDYHKMEFAEGYVPGLWFNRLGSHTRAFDTPYGRCGLMICNDRWNPDLAKILALDGAAYILIPAAGNTTAKNDATVLGRAQENDVPIVEAEADAAIQPELNGQPAEARSLIIDKGEIMSMNRELNVISFGVITIPIGRESWPDERDALEAAFLKWRAKEMPRRWAQWLDRQKQLFGRDVSGLTNGTAPASP